MGNTCHCSSNLVDENGNEVSIDDKPKSVIAEI